MKVWKWVRFSCRLRDVMQAPFIKIHQDFFPVLFSSCPGIILYCLLFPTSSRECAVKEFSSEKHGWMLLRTWGDIPGWSISGLPTLKHRMGHKKKITNKNKKSENKSGERFFYFILGMQKWELLSQIHVISSLSKVESYRERQEKRVRQHLGSKLDCSPDIN